MPQIPILVNPKPVSKHTKLVCEVDMQLKKLAEQNQADAMKEKEKKDKDDKEAKDEPAAKKPKKS